MAFTIVGKIFEIGNIESIPFRDTVFQKRTLVLDVSRYNPMTGEKYENYPKFEISGKHVNDLDGFQPGQFVTVSFVLNGRKSEKDGIINYFTSIQAYKIEPYVQENAQVVSAPSPTSSRQQAQPALTANPSPSMQNFPPACDSEGKPVDDQPF